MDVSAFNAGAASSNEIVLGAIAQQIWTGGFKRSQERTIQVSRPINALAPNLYDRLTKMENFQFACGQSFADVGAALVFTATQPDKVPVLAHLRFKQGNQYAWLGNAGIQRVELVEKRGALVIFGYTVIGGTWSQNKTF